MVFLSLPITCTVRLDKLSLGLFTASVSFSSALFFHLGVQEPCHFTLGTNLIQGKVAENESQVNQILIILRK